MCRRPGHTVRIDLRVPPDLRRAFGMAAAVRGVTMSTALRDCMAAYIESAISEAPGTMKAEALIASDDQHD